MTVAELYQVLVEEMANARGGLPVQIAMLSGGMLLLDTVELRQDLRGEKDLQVVLVTKSDYPTVFAAGPLKEPPDLTDPKQLGKFLRQVREASESDEPWKGDNLEDSDT